MDNPQSPFSLETLHQIIPDLIRESSLEAVLERTAEVGRHLTNARYAAVVVFNEQGQLSQLVYSGAESKDAKRFSQPSFWKEIIATLQQEARPSILLDARTDPRLAGIPIELLQMRSFLGGSIAFQGTILGEIILAQKSEAPAFGVEDCRKVEILASFAAAAIENARSFSLLQESEREKSQRNEELSIFNDVSVAASNTLDLEGILATTLDRMMLHCRAPNGQIFLLEEETGDARMAMQRGDLSRFYWERDVFPPGEGMVGRAVTSKELTIFVDPPQEFGFDDEAFRAEGLRMLLGIPLISKGRILGAMILSTKEVVEYTPRQKALFEAVGLSVGTAVENGLLHRKAQRLAVMEERERIGMDLHDGIIQSIYAVGLSLEEGLLESETGAPETRARLERAISGLNAIIRDIREYIQDLRPKRFIFKNLAVGLDMLVREFQVNTPISAEAELSEEAGRWLAPTAADALFHIAQEALSNVARHSHASRIKVTLAQVGDRVVLEVADNGHGFDSNQRTAEETHGLSNMEERARSVHGELSISSEAGKGACVRVSIPRIRPQTGNLAGRISRGTGQFRRT
jgi:two-component system sensor histidine kinase DevS